jgi:protein-disulfide isomerase
VSHRREEKDRLRAEREAAEAGRQDAVLRRRRLLTLSGIVAAALVAVVVIVLAAGSGEDDGDAPGTGEGQSETSPLAGIAQSGTSLGDPNAPVVLTEFADLQCPFCADYAVDVLPTLIDRYVKSGKLRLEIRLLRFVGPDSDRAARAAQAAAEDNRMWNFVDAFYRQQGPENSGYVTDEFLTDVARAADVNPDVAVAAANEADFETQLGDYESEASAAGIDSTPSFLLTREGGKPRLLTVPELTVEAFEEALRPALSP